MAGAVAGEAGPQRGAGQGQGPGRGVLLVVRLAEVGPVQGRDVVEDEPEAAEAQVVELGEDGLLLSSHISIARWLIAHWHRKGALRH